MTVGRMGRSNRTYPSNSTHVKERRLHVTLAGDRTGEDLIAEERPDGSLVLLPDTSAQALIKRMVSAP
jgi:hypothetical protein